MPAAKPPVREADRWRGSGGTGRFTQLEPTPPALPAIRLNRPVEREGQTPALLGAPRLLVAGGIVAFAAGFGTLSVLRHRAFESGRFDLGNMVQAVWSTAEGRPLEVTNLQGEQVSRLASHVDPLLAAFAPLWLLWPSPSLLLVAQAIAVALGAVPVFWLAQKHLGSAHAGVAFAFAYLLYPPVQWLTLDDFHAVALACPLLLFAFWYLDENRLGAFAAFAVPAVLAKEEIGLVVAAMGVWYAVSHGRRRAGAAIAALGAAWSTVAIAVVIPAAGDDGSDFYGRYEEVGGSPVGILGTAVTDPGRILSAAFDRSGVEYLAELLLPLAGYWLLAPAALVLAVPELAVNLLSSAPTQTSIHFHYTAGLVPGLVAASVLGAARLARRRPSLAAPLGAFAVVVALVGNYRLGAIPVWRHLPGGEDLGTHAYDRTAHDRVAERALDVIPDGDPVTATNTLGAHLSARRRVLSFPLLTDARWIAVDARRPSLGDRLDPPGARARIAAIRRDPAWRIVFRADGVFVLRRR
jgi:uncharacterized membrane protein